MIFLKLIYNTGIHLLGFGLQVLSLFNEKIKLGVDGRKNSFNILNKSISKKDKTIWMHCASLGEYEQGLPVLKSLKVKFPKHKSVVTFFSPSGYEIKKDSKDIDVALYLPLDTISNAKQFLDLINPKLILFVKYEIWPNILLEAKNRNIPSLLVSATFRKEQAYFKWHGTLLRKALFTFTHIFTQDSASKKLLEQNNYNNVSIAGDTRFDRVNDQLSANNKVVFIEEFIDDKLTVIFGSTWPADDDLFITYINSCGHDVKFVIAPHNIKPNYIESLKKQITRKTVCFSEMKDKNLADQDVFILDTIGYLSKVYSYADVTYVGGAAGNTGLHNILEPAVFGMPIIIGENYSKFPEAKQLIEKGGLFSVEKPNEFQELVENFITDKNDRKRVGEINSNFIKDNTGVVRSIISFIDSLKISN